jgi:uncharacterized protein (TIGR00251 family)
MATSRPEALVKLRVQPRASRDEIVGWQDEALRVRVTAAPVEGEANTRVRQLVARALGVATSNVALVRGDRSRDKLVRVTGLSLADVRARLAAMIVAAVLVAGPFAGVAAAEHLGLEQTARPFVPAPALPFVPPPARPFLSPPVEGNFSMRMEDGTFHIGGRLFGLGQALGGWLRGQLRDGGVTLDGQLQGDRVYNFRLEADGLRPSLKIEISPGTL